MKRKIINTILITLISYIVVGQQSSYFIKNVSKIATLNFENTQFDSKVIYLFIEFDSIVNFNLAKFNSEADFSGCRFNSGADFRWAEFNSGVDFGGAEFYSEANFGGAKFHSEANFFEAMFYSKVKFRFTGFDSVADFTLAKFDSVADFSSSGFNSGAKFDFTYLPKILYFNNVEIKEGVIDFTKASVDSIPDKKCHIYLSGTDVSKIMLRYESFKLMFEDSIPFDLKSTIYENLLLNTEMLGYKKSYELLDKEYKEITYLQGYEKPKWFRNWLEKNWWGYGYNKELIIRNTILLFLFFSLINSIFLKQLLLNIYEMPKLLKLRNSIEGKNKIMLLIRVFPLAAFYTGFIFFGLSFSVDKLKYSENLSGWKILNLIYFFIVYLAGIVCLGYLANYILNS